MNEVFLSALMALAIFAIDLQVPLGVAAGVPYAIPLLFLIWKSNSNKLLITSACIYSILVGVGYTLSRDLGIHWQVVMNRALALQSIWLTVGLGLWYQNRRADLEKALAEKTDTLMLTKQKLYGLLQASPDALFVVDITGRVAMMNKLAEDMFGYDMEELIGQKVEKLIAQDLRETHIPKRDFFTESALPGEIHHGWGWRAVKKDGSEFIVETSLGMIETEGQKYVACTIRDVSERARTERELAEQQEILKRQASDIAISQAEANLALRIGEEFDRLLSKASVGLENKTYESVEQCVSKARRLAQGMLLYSGKGSSKKQVLNLAGLVRDNEYFLQLCVGENVDLEVCAEKCVQEVRGDPIKLRELLVAIVTNANDAIGRRKKGRIRIDADCAKLSKSDLEEKGLVDKIKPNRYAWISISDNGHGMDEEDRSQIFDPFFTTKSKSPGLGLAAAKGIIRSHRGYIHVTSEEGKGTKFYIYIPVVKSKK